MYRNNSRNLLTEWRIVQFGKMSYMNSTQNVSITLQFLAVLDHRIVFNIVSKLRVLSGCFLQMNVTEMYNDRKVSQPSTGLGISIKTLPQPYSFLYYCCVSSFTLQLVGSRSILIYTIQGTQMKSGNSVACRDGSNSLYAD